MQNKDYRWFLDNYDNLFKEYGHRYLAIKNRTILGSYSTYADAVRSTLKTEEIGTFIVQLCNGNETAYTNYISSLNVLF